MALTGCESSTGGSAAPVTPSMAPDVPVGFDPCTDVPQSVLDSEGLRNKIPDDTESSSGVMWRGCLWGQPDGYSASIQTTNLTLDMVRDKNFSDATEFTVGPRKAISTRQLEEHSEESCFVNIEMNGGSLEFGLTNPSSGDKTGHLDTCELARGLAEKVAPSIPAGS
ncbi:DUF3558 domain-containing protein [Nocardia carnea]|uniref:DUF3558 domain-containing protein n=1 Tax=Nocardia carnea TaxID=37328 RepID=UPI002457F663|nr:DUF3558 domain-containing protein [Nocardia carnea]